MKKKVIRAAAIILSLIGLALLLSERPGHLLRGEHAAGKKSVARQTGGKVPVAFQSTSPARPPVLSKKQRALLKGARSRLGDKYDSGYYSKGYPPEGKSACVDVIYFAYKRIGINLRKEVNDDIQKNPNLYPVNRDSAINHRWSPNLIVWFRRHTTVLSKKKISTYQAGDVVFWSLTGDGVADHCGIISDRKTKYGIPLVIHQFPPECKEEDCLNYWPIMGHFRI